MTHWDSGYSGSASPPAPAGWYPIDPGLQRYWDGAAWTEHTAPLARQPAPQPIPQPDLATPPPPIVAPPIVAPPIVAPPNVPPAVQPAVAPDAPAPWVHGLPAAPTEDRPSPQVGGYASQPFAVAPIGSPVRDYTPERQPHYAGPVSGNDSTLGLIMHLLGLVSGFLGPLVLWLVKRDESPFLDHHGKEALNFQITMILYWIVSIVAMLVVIGFLFIPLLLILQLVLPIVAGIAAGQGEGYRYPLTLRVIT